MTCVANVTALCRFLDKHADWICSQDIAETFQEEIMEAANTLRRAANMHRDVHKLSRECKECGTSGHLRRYGPRLAPRTRPDGTVVASPVVIACDGEGGCGAIEYEKWVEAA